MTFSTPFIFIICLLLYFLHSLLTHILDFFVLCKVVKVKITDKSLKVLYALMYFFPVGRNINVFNSNHNARFYCSLGYGLYLGEVE